ncbi:hypothetical protein DFJ74DRAFT_476172 [Hyaloraphidium curvatum]|nr:hypothetical protein DFJ74DRAFT_476172 [Hyaloraphidium curvatum]
MVCTPPDGSDPYFWPPHCGAPDLSSLLRFGHAIASGVRSLHRFSLASDRHRVEDTGRPRLATRAHGCRPVRRQRGPSGLAGAITARGADPPRSHAGPTLAQDLLTGTNRTYCRPCSACAGLCVPLRQPDRSCHRSLGSKGPPPLRLPPPPSPAFPPLPTPPEHLPRPREDGIHPSAGPRPPQGKGGDRGCRRAHPPPETHPNPTGQCMKSPAPTQNSPLAR